MARDRDGLQEQAQYYQTENADLRDRMQGLANQNRDLEMRLSRALAHLDSRSHPGNINNSSYNVNESVVDRSRERAASGSAHDVYENVYDVRARSGERASHSPLRPALAARSPCKELSNVQFSNQRDVLHQVDGPGPLHRSGVEPGRSPLRSKSRSHSRSVLDQSMPGAVHQ